MKAIAIGAMNLRRAFRDRTALFFMLVLPFILIAAIGSMYGSGFTPALGVVSRGSGPLGEDLLERLEDTDGIRVRTFDDREALTQAVERGQVEAGLVIPAGYDRDVRAGATVELPYIARPSGAGQDARLVVTSVVDEQGIALRAARFAEREGAGGFDQALRTATALEGQLPQVTVRATTGGSQQGAGTFAYGAAQELLLFVFVISLAAAGMLIESRRIGASRRMLASPTPAGTVVLGETLGRFGIALFEGLLIAVVTALVFRVDWGDPLGTGAILFLFALVGTGAAMLMGSTLDNAQQAGALGTFVGLGFAALGGSMVPLEIFPPAVRTAAHVTPHAWAIDAFGDILTGGSIADIAPELGVLALYAAALLTVAAILFRRKITA